MMRGRTLVALDGENGFPMRVDGPGRLDGRRAVGNTDDDDFDCVVRARPRLRPRLLTAFDVAP